MVLRMPSGVLSRYPFSGALGLGTFWAGPLASALRYSPLLALLPALLLELPLVAALDAPEAVEPSPAVVMSCGTQAASRVLRLRRVPPVSIERRFSMLGFMVGPPHRCSAHRYSAGSPAYLHYARARTGSLSLILPSGRVAVYLAGRLRGLHLGGCFNQPPPRYLPARHRPQAEPPGSQVRRCPAGCGDSTHHNPLRISSPLPTHTFATHNFPFMSGEQIRTKIPITIS